VRLIQMSIRRRLRIAEEVAFLFSG